MGAMQIPRMHIIHVFTFNLVGVSIHNSLYAVDFTHIVYFPILYYGKLCCVIDFINLHSDNKCHGRTAVHCKFFHLSAVVFGGNLVVCCLGGLPGALSDL